MYVTREFICPSFLETKIVAKKLELYKTGLKEVQTVIKKDILSYRNQLFSEYSSNGYGFCVKPKWGIEPLPHHKI